MDHTLIRRLRARATPQPFGTFTQALRLTKPLGGPYARVRIVLVELGTTEVWEVRNDAGIPHSFHVHDVRFRVLQYAGGPPPPALRGLKDTVYVPPGESVRLVTRFSDYADPSLPYMFHCHILQHEDGGMMGQFVVIEPGQQGEKPLQGHEH